MGKLGKIKPNEVSANVMQYKQLVAGRAKTGKSSLFRDVVYKKYDGDMSKGLLVAFERGYQALSGIHAIDIAEWEDFIELVEELVDEKDDVSYKVIALDTIDVLISRATAYMLSKASIKDKKKYTAVGDLSFGKGYEMLDKTVSEQIDKLDQAGYSLFFITHDKDKTITTRDGLEYTKTVMSATGRTGDYFRNSADIITFIELTKEIEKGKKVDKRYIYFRGDADMEAGSRFKHMPVRVEYSADNYINAIEDAIKAEYGGDNSAVEEAKESQAKEKEAKKEEEASQPTVKELIAEIDKGIKTKSVAEKKELAGKIKEEFGVGNYKKFEDTKDLNKVLDMLKNI